MTQTSPYAVPLRSLCTRSPSLRDHGPADEREDDLRLLQSASHAREEPSRILVPKAVDADDEDNSDGEGSSDDDDDDDEVRASTLCHLQGLHINPAALLCNRFMHVYGWLAGAMQRGGPTPLPVASVVLLLH